MVTHTKNNRMFDTVSFYKIKRIGLLYGDRKERLALQAHCSFALSACEKIEFVFLINHAIIRVEY